MIKGRKGEVMVMEPVRKGYEIFMPFLDGHEKEMEEGKEIVVEVRSLEDFTRKVVRAKIAKEPSKLPDGIELWVKDAKDEFLPEIWRIKIVEELPEETPVTRSEVESPPLIYSSPISDWHAKKELMKLQEEKEKRRG
jgi:hypothetical protein